MISFNPLSLVETYINKDYDAAIARENREAQERWNKEQAAISRDNLQFQKDKWEYDKILQQTMLDREDTAYQRTVNDMRAAGISPLAMNGTNSAGEAISTEAPQQELNTQPYQNNSPQTPVDFGITADFGNLANFYLQAKASKAQIKNLEAQTEAQQIENRYNSAIYDKRLENYGYQSDDNRLNNLIKQYEQLDKKRQYEFNSYFGIHESMPEKERAMMFALKALGKDYKSLSDIQDKSSSFVDKLFGSSDEPSSSYDKNDFSIPDNLYKQYEDNNKQHEQTVDKIKSSMEKYKSSPKALEKLQKQLDDENARFQRRKSYLDSQAYNFAVREGLR